MSMGQDTRWKPRVTVAAIVEREGRFLMVEEEAKGGVVFNQPAGHLEPGESLIDAVIREAREETGWTIRPTAVVGLHQWASPGGADFLRVAFAGEAVAHDPGLTPDEGIRAVLWLSRDEIAAQGAMLRSPMVLRCIDDYLAGKRHPLDLLVYLDRA